MEDRRRQYQDRRVGVVAVAATLIRHYYQAPRPAECSIDGRSPEHSRASIVALQERMFAQVGGRNTGSHRSLRARPIGHARR